MNVAIKTDNFLEGFFDSPKEKLEYYLEKYKPTDRCKEYCFTNRINIGEKSINQLYCTACNKLHESKVSLWRCPECDLTSKVYRSEYASYSYLINIFFIVEVLDRDNFNLIRLDRIVNTKDFNNIEIEIFVRGYVEYRHNEDEVWAYILKRDGGYRRTKNIEELGKFPNRNYTEVRTLGEKLNKCDNFFNKTGYKELENIINHHVYSCASLKVKRLLAHIYLTKNKKNNNLELLAKAGYTSIVERCYANLSSSENIDTSEMLRRKGSSIRDIIKLPRNILRKVKELDLNEQAILRLEAVYREGGEFETELLDYLNNPYSLSLVLDLNKLGFSNKEIHSYIVKADRYQAIAPKETLEIWRDYISMCKHIDIPYKKFPNSLKKEHDLAIRNYEYIKTEKIEEQFQTRVDELSKYEYEDEKYMIVAPKKTEDVIREGEVLRHCVSSYIENIANGYTSVLFIREKNNPDKPFYTLELRDDSIVQVRGFANRSVEGKELKQFIEGWEKEKIG